MKFYNQKIVEKVREERKLGASIRTIYKKFKIPETTLSRWIRDIPSSNKAFQDARKREANQKNTFQALARRFPVNENTAKILLGLLYWCEGTKHPSENCVAFTNSDWDLCRVFLELLRKGMPIKEDKLRAKLQIHTTHDYPQILSFWSKLLKIPSIQFHKPTITKPTFHMKRRNYLGTCTVKYYDVKLLLQISGIFEAFAKKW